MLSKYLVALERKRDRLNTLKKTMVSRGLDSHERSQRLDITYSSNALEGNTLTAGETVLVIEKGITVSGKPLRDHLEAVDHAEALDWVLDVFAKERGTITQSDIRNLQYLVVKQSKTDIAGSYADVERSVNTDEGVRSFPPPTDVLPLMEEFVRWLNAETNESAVSRALESHSRLVNIHPFEDGNGRTSRLLMNLMLVRSDFPPVAIRPSDRADYLAALEADNNSGDYRAITEFLVDRLDRALDEYISAAIEAQPNTKPKPRPDSGPSM